MNTRNVLGCLGGPLVMAAALVGCRDERSAKAHAQWTPPHVPATEPAARPASTEPSLLVLAPATRPVANQAPIPASRPTSVAPVARDVVPATAPAVVVATTAPVAEPTTRVVQANMPATLPVATAPSTMPVTRPQPGAASETIVAQLGRILAGKAVVPADLAALPPDEQRIVAAVLQGVRDFIAATAASGSAGGASVMPLLEMADQMRAQVPLTMSHLAVCQRVDGYGVYQEMPMPLPAMVPASFVLYCEVAGFHSRVGDRAMYETRLTEDLELVDDAGNAIWKDRPSTMVDSCRNLRRDFFLARVIRLPASIPSGNYKLKLTLTDQVSGETAEVRSPVQFAVVK